MKTIGESNWQEHWIIPCLMLFLVLFGISMNAPVLADDAKSFKQSSAKGFAHEQNIRLGRGVNILGYDPIWKSWSDSRFRAEHFKQIRDAGFDHVRIVLHPFRDARADGTLDESYWKTLDWAVKQARANRLAVVLDFHEFLEMGREPVGNKERFLKIWKQISSRYKDAPSDVYFEILNEPHDKLTPKLWNKYLREALAVIRKTNPDRTVIIGPGRWNSIDLLQKLDLPADDRNIIVTVHYYNPFEFTHQGTPWTSEKDKVDVRWEGTRQQREAVERDFNRSQAWSEKHNRPIYLGEFGAFDKADMASRVRYLNFVVRQAQKRGWSWAYWQFDSNFILYDMANGRWIKPILDALMKPAH